MCRSAVRFKIYIHLAAQAQSKLVRLHSTATFMLKLSLHTLSPHSRGLGLCSRSFAKPSVWSPVAPRNLASTTAMAANNPRTAVDEIGVKGEFKRTDAGFRNKIEPGGRFEPEGQFRELRVSNRARAQPSILVLPLTCKMHVCTLLPVSWALPPLRLAGLSVGVPLFGCAEDEGGLTPQKGHRWQRPATPANVIHLWDLTDHIALR